METKEAFAVTVNTDLTEGRGRQYIKHICEIEATAVRLAHRADVQGSNGTVIRIELQKKNSTWFGPVNIEPATDEDHKKQRALDTIRETEEKARSLGMSDEDLDIIRQGRA